MDNTFWVPECNKCIHNKECEEKHIYCDGINYKAKEIEETYTEQKTTEHTEDLLKREEIMNNMKTTTI